MKNFTFSTFFVLLLSVLNVQAQNWESSGITFDVIGKKTIDIDNNDIVYISSIENDVLVIKRKINGAWENVGLPLNDADSFGSINLRVSPNGTPYVAYEDDTLDDKLTVRRFINGVWELVGTQGFTTNRVPNMVMELDSNGNPYVFYPILGQNGKAKVQTFINGSWTPLGTEDFSSQGIGSLDIAIGSDNIPMVLYQDGGKLTARKFDSGNWQLVGDAQFSGSSLFPTFSLALDSNNNPYVAYLNIDNGNLVCETFDGSSWVVLGGQEISDDPFVPSIIIDKSDFPVVVYEDRSLNPERLSAKRFDGSDWNFIGVQGFSVDYGRRPNLAVNSENTIYLTYNDTGSSITTFITTNQPHYSKKINYNPETKITSTESIQIREKGYYKFVDITLQFESNDSDFISICTTDENVNRLRISNNGFNINKNLDFDTANLKTE